MDKLEPIKATVPEGQAAVTQVSAGYQPVRPTTNAIRFLTHQGNHAWPLKRPSSFFNTTGEEIMSTAYFETNESATSTTHLLNRLLRMADTYLENGLLKQASEMYFEIAEQHEPSGEGQLARQRLIAIAETYEQSGQPRQARSVYERLLGS